MPMPIEPAEMLYFACRRSRSPCLVPPGVAICVSPYLIGALPYQTKFAPCERRDCRTTNAVAFSPASLIVKGGTTAWSHEELRFLEQLFGDRSTIWRDRKR